MNILDHLFSAYASILRTNAENNHIIHRIASLQNVFILYLSTARKDAVETRCYRPGE